MVFEDFGLADSAHDPTLDPRLERLLALEGTEVWVKLSGIGRVMDGCQGSGGSQLLWGSEWPHVTAAQAYAPSYAETLAWLEELIPDADARGRILSETPAALYGIRIQDLFA
ncbi:putative TIM-barrel fold metal-dependent hydrolase [Bradyrhizobium sp. USDA 4503]